MRSIAIWSSDNFISFSIESLLDDIACPFTTTGCMQALSNILQEDPSVPLLVNLLDNSGSSLEKITFLNQNRQLLMDRKVVLIANSSWLLFIKELLRSESILIPDSIDVDHIKKLLGACISDHPRLPAYQLKIKRGLTASEKNVLSLLLKGMDAWSIARMLQINYKTVQFHKMNIIHKFDIHNSLQFNQILSHISCGKSAEMAIN